MVSPRRSIWQPNGDAPKSSSSCSAAAPTPNPDSAGCDNWTPLQIAIHRDRALVVELLLAGGANVTIWAAAALGRLDIVETFGEQVIALGPNDATQGRKLNVPGRELEGVYDGMEFLRSFNEGTPMPLGERIVVIGGGNVAYDVPRSALRPTWMKSRNEAIKEINRDQQMAYDVARSALRMSGDKEVHVVCLESREEMPADEIEVEEGKEEGVRLHARRGPLTIEGRDGKVKSFRAVKCLSVFDENKRFSPKFDEHDVEEIAADTVIFAIGQTSDLSFLDPADGVASERGLIKVHPETYQTTAPDVFACGDIALGPRLFIDAVA